MAPDLPPAVVVLGQTAVGKTRFALAVAEEFNGEIVNVDASAFYRGMDIGTAKPTPQERARVPHHLVDIADPADTITLGQFKDLADAAMAAVTGRGRVPFITGGSGLYIHALVHNYQIPDVTPDPAIREALEERAERIGAEAFHAELATVDPQAAAGIHPNNVRRVIRALEVYYNTGEPMSDQQGHGPPRYAFTLIGLERETEDLYARIDERIDRMVARGFAAEVRQLLAAGIDPALPSMSAIGYRELAAVERGEIDMEEAITQMRRSTRRLARHQNSWFTRDDMAIRWIDAAAPDALEQARSLLDRRLPTEG
ncbi:MAG: tRNA (adenosine(37)-N6)-dimethylallyltransferase MiaA [Chloroflexi bacterium]|nr:tRNA (adenosine(37)-N6)-dimethylallyltransferase MiaA [Chloroflexota bacterium]